ncbi:hypothetical protein F5Y15DRAFT_420777 [Xylariaceae sp. FL0016]|nr:hypothetical protein F5Y15DRAFT_420777 [Xylariaceae sp. FL0016]
MVPSIISEKVGPNGILNDESKSFDGKGIPSPVDIPQSNGNLKEHDNEFHYPPRVGEGASYSVPSQYHSKPSKLRVACIGTGASGLCLAYKMIPSPLYTFTWDQKPGWSHYFAYGSEIRRYFEDFAKRHGSEKYMKLDTKVIEARWNEEDGIWHLILEDQNNKGIWHDWCHCLINGTGILNNWAWPDIKGFNDFAGPKTHSAHWDHSIDFEGKTVGIIGGGPTGVQLVPQLQRMSQNLKVFLRSANWISPPFGASTLNNLHGDSPPPPGSRQYAFTDDDKKKFREDPEDYLMFRKGIEAEINSLFSMYIQGSDTSRTIRKVITEEMNRRIGPGHEKLKEFLIPHFAPECRRISPGDGYLEALVAPNVEPVLGNIQKIVPEGIMSENGTIHKLDILVCATGFHVAFRPAFKLINAQGRTLDEDWEGVNMYFGVSAPRFPNYYTIVGPGATWSSGTLLPSIETTVEYAVKMMKKIQHEHIRSIDVRQDSVDEIYAHFDEFHKNTVFQEGCNSWYKIGKTGHLYLWPGSTIHFLKTMKEPRFEDYNIRYRYPNRFASLGNGDVKAVTTNDTRGLSTYIRDHDHEWSVE